PKKRAPSKRRPSQNRVQSVHRRPSGRLELASIGYRCAGSGAPSGDGGTRNSPPGGFVGRYDLDWFRRPHRLAGRNRGADVDARRVTELVRPQRNRAMLVLTRKLMEKLFIGDDICITVVRLEGGQVRLGIDAPREVTVVRAELVPERASIRPRGARAGN